MLGFAESEEEDDEGIDQAYVEWMGQIDKKQFQDYSKWFQDTMGMQVDEFNDS